MKHTKTHPIHWNVAFSGIAAAAGIVLLFLGSSVPGAMYLAPAGASVFVAVVREECGLRWSCLVYLAAGLLSSTLLTGSRSVLLFLILIGYYPLLKSGIDRLPVRPLRPVLKLAWCNVTMAFFFRGMLGLMLAGELFPGVFTQSWMVVVCFVVFGDAMFLIYDFGLSRFLKLYRLRLRPFLRSGS